MRFKPGSSVSLWRLLDHPQTHDIQSFSLHLSRLIHLEDGMKDMFYEGGNITGNGAFSHTYKGYVEMTKVTNDNTGDSCYLVAVMVEKSSTSTGASST